MNRSRTTEDPGVWRLVHVLSDDRSTNDAARIATKTFTLEIFEGPGVRARTIEIIADGEIRIDGAAVMSALAPRLRKRYARRSNVVDVVWTDIHGVAQEVADASGTTVAQLRGRSHEDRISQARKVAMFLASRRLGLTHKDVGGFFGRETSTVTSHIADVVEQMKTSGDPA